MHRTYFPKQFAIVQVLLLAIWMYFFVLMAKITAEYFPIANDVAFLTIKQEEVHQVEGYLLIFYVHVIFALFVLCFGLIQLFPIQKIISPKIHRISGYLYVCLVLILAAPSGLFIGYYANGGIGAIIAFELLGILWIFYTIRAMYRIKSKNYRAHQYDMWRSYALAFSAITLRFWKVIIVALFQPNPLDAYLIVAWLGWVLNLIVIESIICYHKKLNQ